MNRTEIREQAFKLIYSLEVHKEEQLEEILGKYGTVNKEDETFIQDANVLRNFFELAGYKRWFYKEKKACGVYCSFEQFLDVTFHLELEIVNNLKYVEIEVTDTACSSRDVKQSLNDFVKALNLDPQKKDTRSWVALLTEC